MHKGRSTVAPLHELTQQTTLPFVLGSCASSSAISSFTTLDKKVGGGGREGGRTALSSSVLYAHTSLSSYVYIRDPHSLTCSFRNQLVGL